MRKLTRRELLKVSLGTMGALALANLPNWNKPALRVGVLPAHAQTSRDMNDLLVRLTWDTGVTEPLEKAGPVDLDNHVDEPLLGGGHQCIYYDRMDGETAHLDIDNSWGFGPENIYVGEGDANPGTYLIYLGFSSGETFPTTATISVKTFVGKPNQQSETFQHVFDAGNGEGVKDNWIYIATAEFPSGDIYVGSDKAGTHIKRPAK
jgi:hypothetical protein